MEQIQFCEGPFSILPVMKLLKENEASYKVICDNWKLFGYSLSLSKDEIDGLQDKLSSGGTEIQDIPREVLRLWKDCHDEDANLKVLCDALIDVKVEDLADVIREEFSGEGSGSESEGPTAKRSRRMSDDSDSDRTIKIHDGSGNNSAVSDDGAVPKLLGALEEGRSVAFITKLLDEGADVNVKADENAGHAVIRSLIKNSSDTQDAIGVLNLLIARGYNLINNANNKGVPPLHLLMEYESLDGDLLGWFFKNGADFNAIEGECQDSVLFKAIWKGQGEGIIRKIIEFGGDPNYRSKAKITALHEAASYAHEAALKILIDQYQLDVNERNIYQETPLHQIFFDSERDYEHSLELLLGKKANFEAECDKGYVPLVNWIHYGHGICFGTLMKMKDRLPITQEIASDTLTAIVHEMNRLEEYLSVSSKSKQGTNAFPAFVKFLIQEKNAKLQLEGKRKWRLENWRKLESVVFASSFLKELRTTAGVKCSGEFLEIKSKTLGMIEFHTEMSSVTVPIEIILICLLNCKMYAGFVEVCQELKEFCGSE